MSGPTQNRTRLFQLMGVPMNRYRNYASEDLERCPADWDAVSRHLIVSPQEAAVMLPCLPTDRCPLAVALANKMRPAPPGIVEALLHAFPQSMNKGTSPLYVAMRNERTSVEVWRLLVDRLGRDAIRDKEILLSLLRVAPNRLDWIRLVIEAEPASLSVGRSWNPDSRVLPVFSALIKDAPLETVQLLLQEGRKYNVGGQFGAGGLLLLVKSGDDSDDDSDDNSDDDSDDDSRVPSNCKTVYRRFIEAASGQMSDNRYDVLIECSKWVGAAMAQLDNADDFPPIHGAIQCAPLRATIDLINTRVPGFHSAVDPLGRTPLQVALTAAGRAPGDGKPIILQDAFWKDFLQHYLIDRNNGAAVRTRDNDGNLPLSVAIKINLTVENGLDLVVNAYPEAAARWDKTGRLPLHVALQEGGLSRDDGLECIATACPRAAVCRDAKTGLYPFMLAGCAPASNVDTIYMMLRKDPCAVQGGIRPSAQEVYLMNKHNKERAEWQREAAACQAHRKMHEEERAEWNTREVDYLRQIESLSKKITEMTEERAEWKKKEADYLRQIESLSRTMTDDIEHAETRKRKL